MSMIEQALRPCSTVGLVAAMLCVAPAWAGVSGSVSLDDLQFQLSGPGATSLQLVPNTYYGPDGTLSLRSWVTVSEPYAQQLPSLDRAATVPLMPGDNITVSAELDHTQATVVLRADPGTSSLSLSGYQYGTGLFSTFGQLQQGTWGLDYGPKGQGLLLSAHTTLTITGRSAAQVSSGGDCAANTDFNAQWCDTVGAEAYLELAYVDPVTGERTSVWDQLKLQATTVAPGVAAGDQGAHQVRLTLTNPGDTAMPIAFHYRLQADGYGYGATVVPEPGTWSLMALGLLAVGWRARRRG